MIDTIIISGGNIQNGFALDFLKKRIEESRGEKITLVAADKGMEWFMKNREFIPDLAIGDFDSLSEEGQKYMESLKGPEIIRLKPECWRIWDCFPWVRNRAFVLRSQISGIISHLQKAEPYCTERSSLENMFHSLLWEVM